MSHSFDQNEIFISSIGDALKSLPGTLQEAFRAARKKVMDQTLLNLIEIADVDQQLVYNHKVMRLMELLRIKSKGIIEELDSDFQSWITSPECLGENYSLGADMTSIDANPNDDQTFVVPKRNKLYVTKFFTNDTNTCEYLLSFLIHDGKYVANKSYVQMDQVREFWRFLCDYVARNNYHGRFCFSRIEKAIKMSWKKDEDRYIGADGGHKVPKMSTTKARTIFNFFKRYKLIEKVLWTVLEENPEKLGKKRPGYNYRLLETTQDAIENAISSLTRASEQLLFGVDAITHPNVGSNNSEVM